jgi:gentisate 1,2-dioxygenase
MEAEMSNADPSDRGPVSAERQNYYSDISEHGLTPLWEVLHKLVSPIPKTKAVPFLWRWDEVYPHVLASGELISAEEAERRVLILENPAFEGKSQAVDTLYAGLQMILPGEIARAHRHTASALRFLVHGSGAYTAVDGEKTFMEPGDFIITPSWGWHDHGHEGSEPVIWLDGLDLPMIQFYSAGFSEQYPEERFPSNSPPGYTRARYGANMKPFGDTFENPTSPIFSYPYSESRDALARMHAAEDLDPAHAVKMEYINPLTGAPAMATMSTFLQFFPKGFKSASYRSTDHAVFSVVEGTGTITVDPVGGGNARTMEWGPKDTFVVPGWAEHSFEASDDAVLFSFSDRVVQQKLGLWREERL